MSKPNGPCLNCEDRDEICHAHCLAYKVFRAKLDEDKEKEMRRRSESKAGLTAHYYDVVRKKKGER